MPSLRSLHALSTHRVDGALVRAVCAVLASRGHEGVAERELASPGELASARHVGLGDASVIFRYASELVEPGVLATDVAEHITRREPGVGTYLLATAPSLRDGLALAARFAQLRDEQVALSCHEDAEQLTLRWSGSARLYVPAAAVLAVALIVAELRAAAGTLLGPSAVSFRHAHTAGAAQLTRWLGVVPAFEAQALEVSFARSPLDAPPRARDPALHAHLLRLAEHELGQLERRGTLAGRVRELIAEAWQRPGGVPPSRDELARALRVTPRTLARWLEAEGHSYSALLDDVRFLVATRRLAEPDAPLAELAQDLGFEDQSSFTRAFRRWTGMSPGLYRKRHRADALR